MDKYHIKKAFEPIQPDKETKQKMLTEVMTAKEKHQSYRNFNKPLFISLIVATLLLVVGGTVGYLVSINKPNDFIGIGEGERQEDGAYELRDMFQLDDKHYTIMHESTMDEFGMSATINPEDIGEKIATITTSIDDRLINKEVYHYLPAQSEAVVAVKREETYQLFNFYNFESYEKNEDEDTRRYLEIFGMNEPADIKKIQFIHYGKDQKLNIITEITNSEEIAEFYTYYEPLKNASSQYFDRLFNWSEGREIDEVPAGEGESSPAYEGSSRGALDNAVTIRIVQQSGIFMEAVYYPNIGFISRHEVDEAFANFLNDYINNPS